MLGKLMIAALLLMPARFAAAEVSYSSVVDDLPLMAGMTEVAAEAIVFDTPAGRIVETAAFTSAPAAEVLAFYAGTLPPLGWTKTSPGRFTREDESLGITFEGDSLVRFSLTPEGN